MTKTRKVRQPSQKRGLEKKARIQDAAVKLIAEYGYDGVNTNTIAREAGVSVGTVYAYYQDKRDILLGIIRSLRKDVFEESMASLNNIMAGARDIETVLEAMVRGLLANHQRDKNIHKEILIQALRDPEVHEAYFALDERVNLAMRLILETYADQIEVDDMDAAVNLIKFTADDCIHHLVFDREQPIEAERVIRQLLKMLNRYLKKSQGLQE